MVQSLMQMQNIFIHFEIFKKDYEWFKVKCKCNENLEMYIFKKDYEWPNICVHCIEQTQFILNWLLRDHFSISGEEWELRLLLLPSMVNWPDLGCDRNILPMSCQFCRF